MRDDKVLMLYRDMSHAYCGWLANFGDCTLRVGCYYLPEQLGVPASAQRIYLSLRAERRPGHRKITRTSPDTVKLGRHCLYLPPVRQEMLKYFDLAIGETAYLDIQWS